MLTFLNVFEGDNILGFLQDMAIKSPISHHLREYVVPFLFYLILAFGLQA